MGMRTDFFFHLFSPLRFFLVFPEADRAGGEDPDRKKRKRPSSYRCSKCGLPKRGHECVGDNEPDRSSSQGAGTLGVIRFALDPPNPQSTITDLKSQLGSTQATISELKNTVAKLEEENRALRQLLTLHSIPFHLQHISHLHTQQHQALPPSSHDSDTSVAEKEDFPQKRRDSGHMHADTAISSQSQSQSQQQSNFVAQAAGGALYSPMSGSSVVVSTDPNDQHLNGPYGGGPPPYYAPTPMYRYMGMGWGTEHDPRIDLPTDDSPPDLRAGGPPSSIYGGAAIPPQPHPAIHSMHGVITHFSVAQQAPHLPAQVSGELPSLPSQVAPSLHDVYKPPPYLPVRSHSPQPQL
jgi:hypothetical protein